VLTGEPVATGDPLATGSALLLASGAAALVLALVPVACGFGDGVAIGSA
jgi:hypothetical protein